MNQKSLVGKIGNLYKSLTRVLDFMRNPVLLAIRLYWGWQFFLAGKGKLMNLGDTAAFFAELNIPFPHLNAALAASTECFGGFLLLIGLGSRLVSIPLAITMSVAFLTAHSDQLKNMFENPDDVLTADPFLYLLASVIVMVSGPGIFSIDAIIGRYFKRSTQDVVSNPSLRVEVTRT